MDRRHLVGAGFPVDIIRRDDNQAKKGHLYTCKHAVIVRDLPTHSYLPKFLTPEPDMPAISIAKYYNGIRVCYIAVPSIDGVCFAYIGGSFIDSNSPFFKRAYETPVPLFDRPIKITPSPFLMCQKSG